MSTIEIRKACFSDLPAIMEIIRQAVESLKKRGVDQWQDGYPNEETAKADIEKEISYVACITESGWEQVVGTAVISFEPEPVYADIYDGNWRADVSYAVIHRIATAEKMKDRGVAGKLMDFARESCRIKGISWIRIDTHRDNLVMQKFLEKQGFECRGSITLESGAHRFAYDVEV